MARMTIIVFMLLTATAAFAQGTVNMWYRGPIEGEVTIKDGQTPGRPGYYYRPQPTRTPTFGERLGQPVRCTTCYRWRDLGETCRNCSTEADSYERSQARRGAIYTRRALPGQYWYNRPDRTTTGPRHQMGWPYLHGRHR